METRREHGMGYIYQRKDGKGWRGRIQSGRKADGKIRYINFSGKTEAEVKRKIREYQKTSNPKDFVKDITVAEYIEKWMTTYKLGTLKPSSYDRLENTFLHQIKPAIGDIQLNALTSDDIQKMLTSLKSNGKSYSTIKKSYDCLNSAFKHAVIADDIPKNPMLLVKMPERKLFPQKEIRFFNPNEAKTIIEECGRKYSTGNPVYIYGDAFILMLNTGIRIGEMIGLHKSDWDRDASTLHIRRTVHFVKERDNHGNPNGGYELIANTTKTYSGDRIIQLNTNATDALTRMCSRFPQADFVLNNKYGRQVPPDRLERTFYRLLENIGIDKTGTHSLRHTFATTLFSNNVDVKTVSKILGHASVQITLNTYIHFIENLGTEAVLKLDDIF